MRKLNLILASSAALLFCGSAFGEDVATKTGMKNGGKYGPAGCGLGSMIFEPDSGFTQIFAATTNGSSGNQTFGISSGTSNCSNTGGGTASAKAFVETNRAALSKDIARGRGETLMSLSELAGCSDPNAVGQSLQKNFKQIFPTAKTTDAQVGAAVLRTLKSDATLACGNLA
jgi:hypothetical protein